MRAELLGFPSFCSNINTGRLPGQPEVTLKENVSVVTTYGGKSKRVPPLPQDAGTQWKTITASNTEVEDEGQEEAVESNTSAAQEDPVEPPRTSRDYHDTTALPFLERIRKQVADEQFGKFVEVIKKLYVNKPLLDAMQVPTYAKYIKDILGNKRTLPTTEVVLLTEECSAAILDPLPVAGEEERPRLPHHHLLDRGSTLFEHPLRLGSKRQCHAKR